MSGTYWVVRFVTGGYGNRYPTRKEADQYAEDANRYSERKYGERIVSRVVRFVNYEETAAYTTR